MSMVMTRRAALTGAAALAISAPRATDRRPLAHRLNVHAAQLARAGDLSGAILLAQNGRPVLHAAFGLRDRAQNLANRPDTKFNIASIGKLFTSLAIMRFVEGGRIALDDKLAASWPDYPNRAIAQSVTIAQLLTHTAGVGNHSHVPRATSVPANATQTQVLQMFVDKPPDTPPGGPVAYSNDGYVVLGALIERLSGKPFFQHCAETIFAPLGMKGTGFVTSSGAAANVARAYVRDLEHPGAWRDATESDGIPPSAAGGAYSTVDDLWAFADAMARGRLLNPELTRAWIKGRVDFRGGRYGYGTMEEAVGSRRILGHSGGHYGIAGEVMIFEGLGCTCVVLTNGEVDGYLDISSWIKREVAGESDRMRDYYFTRALIDALVRDINAGREFYARRDPARQAREPVIDVYGFKLIHQSRVDGGLALLRFNAETFADSSAALWSLAEGLRLAGRRGEAVAAYHAYLAREPGDADAQNRIAELTR